MPPNSSPSRPSFVCIGFNWKLFIALFVIVKTAAVENELSGQFAGLWVVVIRPARCQAPTLTSSPSAGENVARNFLYHPLPSFSLLNRCVQELRFLSHSCCCHLSTLGIKIETGRPVATMIAGRLATPRTPASRERYLIIFGTFKCPARTLDASHFLYLTWWIPDSLTALLVGFTTADIPVRTGSLVCRLSG